MHLKNFRKGILFLAMLFGLSLGVVIGSFTEGYAFEKEAEGSYDHIKESDLKLYKNSINIDLNGKNIRLSKFTETGSMGLFMNENGNGLEFVPLNENEIYIGDIISFEYSGEVYIHRIIQIDYDNEGWYALTKGDELSSMDTGKRRFKDIKGVLVGVIF